MLAMHRELDGPSDSGDAWHAWDQRNACATSSSRGRPGGTGSAILRRGNSESVESPVKSMKAGLIADS